MSGQNDDPFADQHATEMGSRNSGGGYNPPTGAYQSNQSGSRNTCTPFTTREKVLGGATIFAAAGAIATGVVGVNSVMELTTANNGLSEQNQELRARLSACEGGSQSTRDNSGDPTSPITVTPSK